MSEDARQFPARLLYRFRGNDRAERLRLPVLAAPFEYLNALFSRRIAHRRLDKKSVELSFRQRIRAHILDRILRCDHHKRLVQKICPAVDGCLPFLHAFKKTRLRFRSRAVNLVRQKDVGENRSRDELKLGRFHIEKADAGNIARKKIGSELYPPAFAADRLRDGLCKQCLSGARNVLEQDVTAAEQRNKA